MNYKINQKIKKIFKKKYNYHSFIIAEVSTNHNGSIKNITKIINQASSIGIDAIKLQLYRPNKITMNLNTPNFRINTDSPWKKYNNLFDIYKKGYTPYEWFPKLQDLCNKKNIILFASVFDLETVNFLEKNRCPIYKIASAEITDIPLLERVSKTKKPVFISTGMANKKDIELALKILKKNCKNIVLLQCTSSYPAPLKEVNIKTMVDYQKKFKVITGYSDHTINDTSAIVAAVNGARVIEKHIILNKKINSLDKFFSYDLKKFGEFVKKIREAEKCFGIIDYKISKSSLSASKNRKSIFACKNIFKGDRFTKSNTVCARGKFGLHPKFLKKILGKKSNYCFKKGDGLKI